MILIKLAEIEFVSYALKYPYYTNLLGCKTILFIIRSIFYHFLQEKYNSTTYILKYNNIIYH